MAVIKFDRDKADSLIRDLNRISSDIERCLRKVNNTVANREVSLYDERLKVYDVKDVEVTTVLEDGTEQVEIVQEEYLKYDYTANARVYNRAVRLLSSKSNSAKSNATLAIQSVVGALTKVKELISEYENDQQLRIANHLGDVGQFDFNFLAGYGVVTSQNSETPEFGAVVVDEAFTSSYLGPLASRPSYLDIYKLKLFDEVHEIAGDSNTSMDDKLAAVLDIFAENFPNLDAQEVKVKAETALNSMIGIVDSTEGTLDESLKIDYLIEQGFNVVVPIGAAGAITNRDGLVTSDDPNFVDGEMTDGNPDVNIDTDGDGKPELNIDSDADGVPDLNSDTNADGQADMNVDTDGDGDPSQVDNQEDSEAMSAEEVGYEEGSGGDKHSEVHGDGDNNGARRENEGGMSQQGDRNDNSSSRGDIRDGRDNGSREPDFELPKIKNEEKVEIPKLPDRNNEPHRDEIPHSGADSIMLDEQLQASTIKPDYSYNDIGKSENIGDVNVEISETTDTKAGSVVAGAVGLGALGAYGSSGGVSAPPVVNGMAAGEMINMNSQVSAGNVSNPANMAIAGAQDVSGNTPQANAATSYGSIESTSDSGTVSTVDKSNGKVNPTKVAGNVGTTLEDKDNSKNENSFGKPNTVEDNNNEQKGMLGDASIAELEKKDEKEVMIATGVTAASAAGTTFLAVVKILPVLMFILILVAIIALYTTYRVKKKNDKKKRREALALANARAINNVIPVPEVQNVEQPVQAPVVVPDVPVVPQQNIDTAGGEFSSQPYEPIRDGVVEIKIEQRNSTDVK